jgi:SsrA-binding protein
MGDDGGPRTIASNKRAFHDYFVEERYEAGLVLTGSEVKSLREGKASYQNHDPTRTRKLLLHRKEIQRLIGKTTRKGLTLVPLRLYWKDGRAKVELGLARGKREYDKRETERRREAQREIAKVMKAGRRGG